MQKTQRIHDLLLYLNDRATFQLKDLMNRYDISRSTAIRDVQSLERLGMPIYSQPGRNGHYGILPNRLLSPIFFHVEELRALYFAMLNLRDYQTTPFHHSNEKLKEKFERCLSPELISSLRRFEQVFQLASLPHPHESPYLKEIVESAVAEQVCQISYQKAEKTQSYTVQFFSISSAFGQWYASAYDFSKEQAKVFRCDRIRRIAPCHSVSPKPLASFQTQSVYRRSSALDFSVRLTAAGRDRFYKEHYPSLQLSSQDGQLLLKGYYHPGEERFIADYLIGYAETILSVEPPALKELIVKRLAELHLRALNW